jgi:hypothetical protein
MKELQHGYPRCKRRIAATNCKFKATVNLDCANHLVAVVYLRRLRYLWITPLPA